MIVIFDLDGTLLHTINDLAAAANAALVANGFPKRTLAECQSFVGNGISKLLERALPQGEKTPQNTEKLRPVFFAYYDAHLTDFTRPYAGVNELLKNLTARGIKLAVASNKYQRATEKLVTHFFADTPFVSVLGQRENIPTKPNAYVVREILSCAHETAQTCLYVGDSEVDMQTAQNAGVPVCAVTWGFRTKEVLAAYHPDFYADTPAEILSLI